MRKPRSKVEVLGDLDDDLLALYEVVRDPVMSVALTMQLAVTPFSDAEYRRACEPAIGLAILERARRLIVRQALQLSPDQRPSGARNGFRRYSGPNRTPAAHDWTRFPDAVSAMNRRLQGVIIERDAAVRTIQRHDGKDVCHYVDPPYVSEARLAARRGYVHEMTRNDHTALLDALLASKGMVVLSGYSNKLYDEALEGWRRLTYATHDHARNARTEVLWISPRAAAAVDAIRPQLSLFDAV
jgi:DNA adenine methylase